MSDDYIYRLLKLLTHALSRLPVWAADFCSNLLGLLWFKIDKRHRAVTLKNLTHCFGSKMGPEQIKIMGKQIFKNIVAIIFEVAWGQKFSKRAFLSHFTIKGLEHIHAAHAKGKGVLVLTCHICNFEMLAPAIDKTGRVFDPRQSESLPKIIRWTLNTPQEVRTLTQAPRGLVEKHHTMDAMGRDILRIYRLRQVKIDRKFQITS